MLRPEPLPSLALPNNSVETRLTLPTHMNSWSISTALRIKEYEAKQLLAKLIVSTLGCDCLVLNASLDRNIETVREEVSHFSRCISSVQGIKRCVFMDEADGLTRQAQDSLRNLMD